LEHSQNLYFRQSLRFSLVLLAVIWCVHLYFVIFPVEKAYLGIYPRQIWGSLGILTSPFVHGSWSHLLSNSGPLVVLSFLLSYFYRRISLGVILRLYLLTGVFVWIFGRSVYHIGASGVIYALVSFVFWSGIFRRQIKAIVLALVVTVLYSGMFLGLIPEQGISWESHLLGALVGIGVAFLYRKEKASNEHWATVRESVLPPAEENAQFFFPQDVFDKTRKQREEEAYWEQYWKDHQRWISDSTE
jgi:membrane associated rhomboid family serine protease